MHGARLRFDLPARASGSRNSRELFTPDSSISTATGFLIEQGQDRGEFGDPPDKIGRRSELNNKLATPDVN